MKLQIREATPADAMLLNTLGYRIYRAHFEYLWESESELEAFLASEYSLEELEQSLKDQAVCWYVAETDRPIGFAKVTYESSIPDTNMSGMLLNKLYLDPADTRKGYGQVMFDTVKELARAMGKGFAWLEVLEQNERACNFYRKQGMTLIKNDYFKTASQQSVIRIMGIAF